MADKGNNFGTGKKEYKILREKNVQAEGSKGV
jgi:hypothetical protein